MDYYFLEFQYPKKGFISGGAEFHPELKINYSAIDYDLPVNTKVEVILVPSVKKMDVDFFHTTTFALLVSDDFKVILEGKSKSQFIPATVKYHNGSVVDKKYWVVHNLKKIDCLDYELSEYAGKKIVLESIKRPPRRIAKGFKKVILDSSKVNGSHVFILDYTYITNPIISSELYGELNRKGIKINATLVGDFQP